MYQTASSVKVAWILFVIRKFWQCKFREKCNGTKTNESLETNGQKIDEEKILKKSGGNNAKNGLKRRYNLKLVD